MKFSAILATLIPLCSLTAAAEKPNIIVILADDMAYGTQYAGGNDLPI